MNEQPRTDKDLDAWKEAIQLVEDVYKITRSFPKEEMYGLPRGICEWGAIPQGRQKPITESGSLCSFQYLLC